MNDAYKKAFNAAMTTLIENELTTFPLNVKKLLKSHGAILTTFKKSPHLMQGLNLPKRAIAFSTKLNDKTVIAYDDTAPRGQLRYTLAHELAHVVDPTFNESQCQIFASRLLMPAIVCKHHDLTTSPKIQIFFDVSRIAAKLRAARIQLRMQRNDWEQNPLERVYYALFLQDNS